jgi:EmrB/QacA subfamily drug resistance transporter
MATLDGSIVNIALPVISQELNATISSVQWVVTSYLLTIAILLLIWGKISDLYGKKKIFTSGFILFSIGSALCGISNSLEMLVFARIFQAFGASAMMALSQGIITATFPANERGKALGITGTMVAIGSLVGPSLGGALVHLAGWESIFWVNIPIGIIGSILAIVIIPEIHEAPSQKVFDYKGAVAFTLSLLLLFLGLLLYQEGTVSFKVMIPMIFAAIVILWIFVSIEKRTGTPLVDLRLLKIHEFSFGLDGSW